MDYFVNFSPTFMLIATLISIFYLTWGSLDLSFESSDPLVYRLDPFSDPVDLFFNPADPKSKHLDPHVNPGAEDIFRAYVAWFLNILRAAILDSTHEGGRHTCWLDDRIGKYLHLLRCLITFKICRDFVLNLYRTVRDIEGVWIRIINLIWKD